MFDKRMLGNSLGWGLHQPSHKTLFRLAKLLLCKIRGLEVLMVPGPGKPGKVNRL